MFDAVERRAWLSDPAAGEVRSNITILRIPFSSTLRACSLLLKVQKGPHAQDSRLLYLYLFLSVSKAPSGGQLTYTNFPMKKLVPVRGFQLKYFLNQR